MKNEAEKVNLKPTRCVKVYLKSDNEKVKPLFLLIFECPESRGIQRGLLKGPFGLSWSPLHGHAKNWPWIDKKDLVDESAHLLEYPNQGVLIPRPLLLPLVLLTLYHKTPEEIAMLFSVPALKTGNDPIDVLRRIT
jgi:hypothetical protein